MNFVIFIWTLKTFSSYNEKPKEVTKNATIEEDHSIRDNSESEIVSQNLTNTIPNQNNATNGEVFGNTGYFESLNIKSSILRNLEPKMVSLLESFYGKKNIWTYNWEDFENTPEKISAFQKTKFDHEEKYENQQSYLNSLGENKCRKMMENMYKAMKHVYYAKSKILDCDIVDTFKNKKVEYKEKLSLHNQIHQIWADFFTEQYYDHEDLIVYQLNERNSKIENEFEHIQQLTKYIVNEHNKNQLVLINASLTGSKVEMETAQKNNTILKKEIKKHVCRIESMIKEINDQSYIQEQENVIEKLIFRYNDLEFMIRTYESECKKLWKNLENDVPNTDKIKGDYGVLNIFYIIKSAYENYASKKKEHDELMKRLKHGIINQCHDSYYDLFFCKINKIALFRRKLNKISTLLPSFANRMKDLISETNQIVCPTDNSSIQITKEELEDLRFFVKNSNGEVRKRENIYRQRKSEPHLKGEKTHKESISFSGLQSIAR